MRWSTSAILTKSCEIAERLTPALQANDERFNLMTVLAAHVRVDILRGMSPAPGWVDAFEGLVRQIGNPDSIANLLSSICVRLSAGEDDLAADRLLEVERTVGVDTSPNYFAYLPAAVRALLAHDRIEDVDRLLARAVPHYAYAAHALTASRAALDEARGDLDEAAAGYSDAIRRWAGFGLVPEHAFSLLGLGRSTLALGRAAEARPALEEARETFLRLARRAGACRDRCTVGRDDDLRASTQAWCAGSRAGGSSRIANATTFRTSFIWLYHVGHHREFHGRV